MRGNENNSHVADGVGFFFGSGGLLAENVFAGAGAIQPPANWRNEQFNTPAAPRSAWVGVRWNFGAR